MGDYISTGNPLLSDATEARNKIALLGGHERLIAKIDDLLLKSRGVGLHGGEQAKLKNLIEQVGAIVK